MTAAHGCNGVISDGPWSGWTRAAGPMQPPIVWVASHGQRLWKCLEGFDMGQKEPLGPCPGGFGWFVHRDVDRGVPETAVLTSIQRRHSRWAKPLSGLPGDGQNGQNSPWRQLAVAQDFGSQWPS